MATYLKVTSPTGGEINVPERYITGVKFETATPSDSGARATEQLTKLTISGEYISEIGDASGEPIQELQKWSYVPGKAADCYRSVEAAFSNEKIMLRKYLFSKAYVADFQGDLNSGDGAWKLVIAQKEDQLDKVEIDGGYPVAD